MPIQWCADKQIGRISSNGEQHIFKVKKTHTVYAGRKFSLNVSCVASCQKAFSMFCYMLSYFMLCALDIFL